MGGTTLKAELDSHLLVHRALRDMAPAKAGGQLKHSFDMFELGVSLGAAVASQRLKWRLEDLLQSDDDGLGFVALVGEIERDLAELHGEDDSC
jgi:hypothetical protein